jgi:hypothetical protein
MSVDIRLQNRNACDWLPEQSDGFLESGSCGSSYVFRSSLRLSSGTKLRCDILRKSATHSRGQSAKAMNWWEQTLPVGRISLLFGIQQTIMVYRAAVDFVS